MRARQAASRERGSVTVLGIGAFLIALALIAVAVDATVLQLRRTELWNVADGAALAAAHSVNEPSYFDGKLPTPTESLSLSDADVESAAARYVRRHVAGALLRLRLEAADAPDEASARVRVSARVRPPFSGLVFAAWNGGIDIAAESRARAAPPGP